MTTEYKYYAQVLADKALLILESEYEDNSAFPTNDDSVTYHLIETVDLERYNTLINDENSNWNSAIKVDENHKFIEKTEGAWCQYTYQHEGCGRTTERKEKSFF